MFVIQNWLQQWKIILHKHLIGVLWIPGNEMTQ